MSKNINKEIIFCLFLGIIIYLYNPISIFATQPASSNFQLQEYGFGAGGANNSTSTNFKLNGIAGEVEYGQLSSSNFKINSGLTFLQTSNVPGSPTLSTPGNNYDRIQFILNTSNNPTDTTYAIQISTTSNFSSNVNYVKSDNTIGSTLTTSDYKTYTNWGGASGNFVTGLSPNTTYYLRVKARQGNFAESAYGPSASTTTNTASLTFTISSPTITFANLNANNAIPYTDNSQSTVITTSTNAFNGYSVYGHDTQALTFGSNTINNYGSPNSAPTTWSGTGFGYTTSDTNLAGTGGANRFATATQYAGFSTSGPGDIIADDAGPVTTSPISNEAFTISYRVTATSTTPSGTYSNVIEYTVVPTF